MIIQRVSSTSNFITWFGSLLLLLLVSINESLEEPV
jgi:hypothetical protein